MKKELLVLAMCVGCSSAACNVSAPGENDDCETQLIEADESVGKLEDRIYDLQMGVGEKVDLVADEPIVDSPAPDMDDKQRQISSLLAEIDRMAAAHAEEIEAAQNRYDGLLEQFRLLDDNYASTVAEYQEFKQLCDLHASGVWQSVDGAE